MAIRDDSHRDRLIILTLWCLLVIWLRPWNGDLRNDPLTYACISKDMVENNNWFSPTIDGGPYLNKPPLYFWLVALSFKIFGVSFYASKVPSLLFATVSVFLLYWIVFRWFGDHDMAFFSAFSFETTRWVVTNFTTNRPESLLVFSILLGCYALVLMKENDGKGPYLLGLSFAIGFLTKLYFAFFLPLIILIYGLTGKRIYQWLRWPHLYYGCLAGLILSSVWFIYFEGRHPGYIRYLTNYQTIHRVTEGLDVGDDPLMYIRELLRYYYPWLPFFIIGVPVLLKRLGRDYHWFVFLAILAMFIPLQISKGKAARYLTMLTPFLSIVAALGAVHFDRLKRFMKGLAAYAVIPLFVFFWTIPVTVNPEKFHVLHLAERLSRGARVDYTDPLAFLRSGKAAGTRGLQFVEWTPSEPEREYRLIHYFYLSRSFIHWDDTRLAKWVEAGDSPVILLTLPNALDRLPAQIKWVELDSDKYHSLLAGVRKECFIPVSPDR